MVEIAIEFPAAGLREAENRFRKPILEALFTEDVASVLQFAGMDTQVPVTRVEEALQLGEGQLGVDGQGAQNAETNLFMNQSVEPGHSWVLMGQTDLVRLVLFSSLGGLQRISRHVSSR